MPQKLPGSISRLEELANNLWWSWHEDARRLFRSLDYPLWRLSVHNPVKLLRDVSKETLLSAASDPAFLAQYDAVLKAFDAEMSAPHSFPAPANQIGKEGVIAYFSMEFAFHSSLPIYAGGLGILAGDICKEASDMALPMVAVGFMYPQGYFHQHISAEGWQEEIYRQLDFDEAPITRVLSPEGNHAIAEVQMGDVTLSLGAWQVRIGHTNVYLLDTNLDGNPEQYRQLSARLYVADREQRLKQEIILGIGGVRVLRALNINPTIWHANEGHTAFMMLERIREKIAKGASFAEALGMVKQTTVFTTHTPVMAGHDVFSVQTMEKYFSEYMKSPGISQEAFFKLGRQDTSSTQSFNMTAFALRAANHSCAVSEPHQTVTRKMWRGIWPDVPEDELPISHVTNGIHVSSWIAPELYHLYQKYLGDDWITKHDDNALWERVLAIPNSEFWAIHQSLKRKLISAMRETGRTRWVDDNIGLRQVLASGALLQTECLTIGFARRFTEYKRPMLLFHDIERLKRIINSPWQPVQIIFAGKSHPNDFASKQLLQQVYNIAMGRDFQGRIAFAEDYDMHIARYLIQGVDVWLNNPRLLQEASGTSGMKASINGVPHLSIPDGWWREGYNGANGWSISSDFGPPSPGAEDETDSKSLYRILEDEVVPLFYKRDRNGVPHGWIRVAKEAIRSTAPFFSARRMLKEYVNKMYLASTERPVRV
ncbi:MAG: alpha-glucan family phosphorylase [Chloroflexi bacterium]|nr:alpha-glucan family phosphorylase [Chloroflexota bacterium]